MSVTSKIAELRASLPQGVQLVAVSKFHPVEALQEAYDAGQRIFGESRVQELLVKQESLPKDIEWHMIGHLQTNKVRSIAPFVALVQSVDSERLLRLIDREAARCGRVIDVLLEVHVTGEQTKSGWAVEELTAFVRSGALATLPNVRVRGIMGMATNTDNEAIIRHDFEQLFNIKKGLEIYFDSSFDTLSMGMSDDYDIAVSCGSNMVRVGSKIFGVRTW